MRQYTKEYIQSLLTKFMDGTTTLEEEDVLNQYFTQGNVPEEWKEYRLLFAEIEGMRPKKAKRRWLGWSAAAAVVGTAVLSVAMLWQPAQQYPTLTAKADTTTVLRPEAPNEQPLPDTTALQRQQPVKPRRPRIRKPEPTIHDYDKAYTLMAEVEQEQQAVKQQIEQARQEITRVQLTAAGFVPVMLEDGTIIYVDEPEEYFAYEE
ncbi:MAG: hypothetical protein IJ633_05630 [Prevotella sp.]|nr:hypothetical protein [Prevotella sp.]